MSKITNALEKAARERLRGAPMRSLKVAPPERSGAVDALERVTMDPHIVSATDSNSPIAEQYRILRTNLQALMTRPGPKVIAVTSAVHSEGKSVTALNLALTFARQEHLKVVLVDADLRKSSLHAWLGLGERSTGLSTMLLQGGQLNGELVRLTEPPLAILPAGPPVEHPTELLESSNMKRLLATLKAQFDLILIDTPPVLPVADLGSLAAHVDGVLLVVRAGKTQRKTVERAQALLAQAHAKLLGCVLTHVEYYLPGYYRAYHYYQRANAPTR